MGKLRFAYFLCVFSSPVLSAHIAQNYLTYLKYTQEDIIQKIHDSKNTDKNLRNKLQLVKQLDKFIKDCKKISRGEEISTEFFDLVIKKYEAKIIKIKLNLQLDNNLSPRDFALILCAISERYFDLKKINYPIYLNNFISENFVNNLTDIEQNLLANTELALSPQE